MNKHKLWFQGNFRRIFGDEGRLDKMRFRHFIEDLRDDTTEEVVRVGGAERRDCQPRLRPGGSVRRVGMHHPAKAGITAV